MRKITLIAAILLLTATVQAKTMQVSVDNRSNKPITISKFDGLLTIPANTIIDNQLFKRNEIVTNYVDGKKTCTWEMKSHSRSGYIRGIFYSPDKIFSPGCIVIV